MNRQESDLPEGTRATRASSAAIPVPRVLLLVQRSWWRHDAQWFRAVARRFGLDAAHEMNLEALERATRAAVLLLRREGAMGLMEGLRDLEQVFRMLWSVFFAGGLYQDSEFVIDGEEGYRVGESCHAYEQLCRGDLVSGYECGCRAFHNGVRRGLGVDFTHEIVESLVGGDGRCRVLFRMAAVPEPGPCTP